MITTSSEGSPTAVVSAAIEKVPVSTDSKGRVRASKEQRRMILEEFERSGVCVAEFARRTGLNYSTLAGWVQRYRQSRPRKRAQAMRLLEAVVKDSCPGTFPLSVHLAGGVRLEIAQLEQVPLAAALLR